MSITTITSIGGAIARMLSTIEPITTSRRITFSTHTMRASQAKVKGSSSKVTPRSRRTRIVSPPQTCDSRNSSTATAWSSPVAIGSRSHTTPRAGSGRTISAAVPSFSNSTIGPPGFSPIRFDHFIRTARAHSPPARTQSTSTAGDGASPSGTRRSSRSNSMPW